MSAPVQVDRSYWEMLLVGSVLRFPDLMHEDSALRQVTPAHFGCAKLALIWRAVLDAGPAAAIFALAVADELHRRGDLELVGGPQAIVDLIEDARIGRYFVPHYAQEVYTGRRDLAELKRQSAVLEDLAVAP